MGLLRGSGSFAYPKPVSPCVSGASKEGCTSGNLHPCATGIWLAFARSNTDKAFVVACSREQFPCTILKPSRLNSGDASASKIAQESSMPGSVSNKIFFGMLIVNVLTQHFHSLQK